MPKKLYKKGECFNGWTLIEALGSGGNGEVWLVENSQKQQFVIKLLRFPKIKAYNRFKDEVKIVTKNRDIDGVIPIIDYDLPEDISISKAWYVMPRATPIENHLKNKSPIEIVNAVVTISKTLHKLHQRKIAHRDIKPENLFWFKNSFYIGDFGLVNYPDKQNFTQKGEKVGPRWTIAPEMERDAYNADGMLADSYSLAKTLWIFLTGERKGFEGQYSAESIVGLKNYQSAIIYTDPLDSLIADCTDNDPLIRPTLEEIGTRLSEWIELEKNYDARNRRQWKEIQEKLFPTALPSRVIWEDIGDIISILNILASIDNLNHMFFPRGGGFDLVRAKISNEDNCIELHAGGNIHIVKPKRLLFESFRKNAEWNYFRLETGGLEPIDISSHPTHEELLTEIEPGVYTTNECSLYDDFNGERLSASSREIFRIFDGDFVVFQKTSMYNRNSHTYDGRHNNLNTEEFRDYVEAATQRIDAKETSPETHKKSQFPHFVEPSSFRINTKVLSAPERNLLNSIICLEEQVVEEDEQLQIKYNLKGVTTVSLSGDWLDYADAPRPKKAELWKFLENLSPQDLILVAAVMYGGRHFLHTSKRRTYPLQDMIETTTENGITGLVDSICGKANLVGYLRAGLAAYSKELGHVTHHNVLEIKKI